MEFLVWLLVFDVAVENDGMDDAWTTLLGVSAMSASLQARSNGLSGTIKAVTLLGQVAVTCSDVVRQQLRGTGEGLITDLD